MFFYEFGTLDGIILLGILVFFFIHVKRKEREEKYKAEHPIWDKPEWHEKWEKRLKEEAEEAERRLDKSKIFISEEKFNAIVSETTKIAKLVNRFCYEPAFIDYYHKIDTRTSVLENGEDLFLHFEYTLLDDILWVYDQLGHLILKQGKCSIDFETVEGQCLYIIDRAVSEFNDEDGYEYRYYQGSVGDPESLSYKAREPLITVFETLTKYVPGTKLEDYQICSLIHNYNPEYEKLYRILMYRIATFVAEADGTTTIEEKQWLTKHAPTQPTETMLLEQTISSYKPPKINYGKNRSNWYEDNSNDEEDYCDLSATVSYSVLDAPEEECDLDNLSNRDLQRLKAADDNGEYLDSDYISEHMHSIHNKIIEAIREDLESKSGDPHDGMVEVHHPPAYWGWEKVHASHQEMSLADEYEIDYTVDVF